MSERSSALKSISELLAFSYYIPSYQRGYRWTSIQVHQLLEDIKEFSQKEKKKTEYYCLQPIVVLPKDDNVYTVIDGQQRLTTLLIILNSLKEAIQMLYEGTDFFEIEYATRPKSAAYLNKMDANLKEENIDFFHMYGAKEAVDSWFQANPGAKLPIIQALLLNETPNVQVIWYELGSHENPIDVFARLNMGKIGLTNAELIKALFLGNLEAQEAKGPSPLQLEIANEWDRYEISLQEEDLWYFLHNGENQYDNHIGFLFDLLADNINQKGEQIHKNKDHTFRYFAQCIKEKGSKESWKDIKACFQLLYDWFSDHRLYHLVGYLISSGTPIHQLMQQTYGKTKTETKELIRGLVKQSLGNENLEELSYPDRNQTLKNVLLLFNVLSIINNSKSNFRFHFGRYKEEEWDIEHIHSVKSEQPKSDAHRMDWIKEVFKFTTNEEIKERLEDYINTSKKNREEGFEKLYDEVVTYYSEERKDDAKGTSVIDQQEVNDLSNLALLDSGTNRAYKNAVFPIKRQKIIERDETGTFVPLCTKNVFLKYYNKQIDQHSFWGQSDRKAYKTAMIECIKTYLNGN